VDQTTAADYGIGGFAVDGQSVGGVFDLYSGAVALHLNDTIGQPVLTAGYHTLTMTVTDKNAASTGYQMGLDDFLLVRG
jgi:hypothetical protein